MRSLFVLLFLFATGTGVLSPTLVSGRIAAAEPPERNALTYAETPNGTVTYQVKIEIGEDAAELYVGELRYRVLRPGRWFVDASLRLSPSAEVNRTGFPFRRSTYLDPAVNGRAELQLSPLGEIRAASDSTQLRLLLGDLLQWAIWPLPEENQKSWKLAEPVMVQQTKRDPRFPSIPQFPRFPAGAGLSPFHQERVSAGIESVSFRISASDEVTTTLSQKYELESNKAEHPINMTGTATGIFDRRKGVFTEIRVERIIETTREGAQIKIPLKISIIKQSDSGLAPLTPEEKLEAERKRVEREAWEKSPEGIAALQAEEEAKVKRAAEATQRAAEMAKRAEERKMKQEAEASAPFDPAQRKAWIATLDASSEYGDGASIYGKLSQRSDRVDRELAMAFAGYASRVDGSLGTMFFDIAAKFDPDFAALKDLRKAYANNHTSIEDLGPAPESVSEIKAGQLVAVKQEHGDRYQARLITALDGERVMVKHFGSRGRIEEAKLADLRFPPKKLWPYLPPSQLSQPAPSSMSPDPATPASNKPAAKEPLKEIATVRTWSDASGRFRTEAEFISLSGNTVRLKKSDGSLVDIPIDKLAVVDAQAARQLADAAANPFKTVEPVGNSDERTQARRASE